MTDTDTKVLDEATDDAADKPIPLNLEIKVAEPSACERHVTVTVPREDINRYYDEAFAELLPKAELPGFRPGKAPRRLVESRFKDQVADQVKGKLLMDSMSEVNEKQSFTAISEPKFDLEAIKIPADGPLTFEFDIEVRPEFSMPAWKGLKLERPNHQFSEDEVTGQLNRLLERYGQLKSLDVGTADEGTHVTVDITVRNQGEIISQYPGESLQIRPVLSFADAKLEGFDKLLKGKNVGDKVATKISVSKDADIETLRGQEVDLELAIVGIQRQELPELSAAFLDRIGGFVDEAELRSAVKEELERQLSYNQQKRIRQQITTTLTVAANWSLPPDLLRRQSQRELERSVLELRSAGFPDDAIRAHSNELRQNTLKTTERALKEHFILERIAEEEKIDADPSDYEREIEMIAAQSDESPRRVRARLEKRGMMDSLRNQIAERKVIDLICMHANFQEMPYDLPKHDVTAITHSIAGKTEAEIPEAKHAPEAAARPGSMAAPKKDKEKD